MSKREITSTLNRELSIKKFIGETDKEYFSRLTYSALGMWARFQASFPDDPCKQDGNVFKATHHRKLNDLLQRYVQLYDEIEEYYLDDDAVAKIRDPLFYSQDLCEIGFSSRLSIGQPVQLGVSNSFVLSIGDTQLPAGSAMSGLAVLLPTTKINMSEEEFLSYWEIPRERAVSILQQKIDHMKWERIQFTSEFEFFDRNRQGTLSTCWASFASLPDGVSILRKAKKMGPAEYYLAKRKDDVIYGAKLSDFSMREEIGESQRLLYAFKAQGKNKCTVNVDHYSQYSIWRFWSKLPPQEECLLRYIGWPRNGITNRTREFVVRNEFNDLLAVISDKLGIVRKEIRHE